MKLLKIVSLSLKISAFFVLMNIVIPLLSLKGMAGLVVERAANIALILALAWLVYQILGWILEIILNNTSDKHQDIYFAKRLKTQLSIIKNILVALGALITLATILMLFDSVRSVGTGLLTTAGLISALSVFASKQSLGRIFSGLQIAFTQPVSIGDIVVIDQERGEVEEISLSYIVIKLWDLRRMIIPTDTFMSKGIINLTRHSTELIGTVTLFVDFYCPIEILRAHCLELISGMSEWNGKVCTLQVAECQEQCLELKITVSADNFPLLSNLRSLLREALIRYITETFPQTLPQTRSLQQDEAR